MMRMERKYRILIVHIALNTLMTFFVVYECINNYLLKRNKIEIGIIVIALIILVITESIFIDSSKEKVPRKKINEHYLQNEIKMLKQSYDENKKLLDKTLKNNKAIAEFTANIAHELRTPLNVIIGALQVMDLYKKSYKNKSEIEFFKKYFETIEHNSFRLLRLVNNIVDVSKIDAGFFELCLGKQDIVSVIENITLSIVPYTESKKVNLIFDTSIEEKIINCDAEKIERIMLNLLSNAAKFTREGDEIRVTLEEEKNYVVIHVKDSGIGIPKDKLQLIFERYRQINNCAAKNSQGSGIGLSLVKSLVELHKGSISVHSKLGRGTEFIIRLPSNLKAENEDFQDAEYELDKQKVMIELSDLYLHS